MNLINSSALASGIAHPLLGFDHLLAMVAVGIISTQIGGKAIWKVPATFISTMVIGGLLATGGLTLPFVEMGIALSVLLFGVFIAFSRMVSANWAMLCVAVFALFHGHAHGEEMLLMANYALYATGFVLSTTLLHISGVLIGHYAQKTKRTMVFLRYAGAGMSMAGFLLLLGF